MPSDPVDYICKLIIHLKLIYLRGLLLLGRCSLQLEREGENNVDLELPRELLNLFLVVLEL